MGLLLEVPQTPFIARVGRHSSAHRDGGLFWVWRRCWAGIFRAPPGCPGVERQFSEPSMMKSSLSSRAPAQLVRSRLWTRTSFR